MNCPYCGREVQDGEVFCACGRPVNLSGAAAGSTPQPTAQNRPVGAASPYLPEGVSLESLHKPARRGAPIWLVALVLLACVGVILFFMFRNSDITDESKWATINRPDYSFKAPKALKDERKRMVTIGADLLDFYSGKEAAILINKSNWNSSQKKMIEELGKDATKAQIFSLFSRRSITKNGVKTDLVPETRGDYVYFTMDTHEKNYIGKSDEVFEINAYYITDDAMYEVSAYCAESDKDKYKETLFKMIDSFRVT